MQTEIFQDLVKTDLSTNKIKKDKFKPLFCGKDFYIENQKHFRHIHNATIGLALKYRVILFTLSLCCLRRHNDWFAGFIAPIRKTQAQVVDFHLRLSTLFINIGILWPPKLNKEITLFDFLATVQIKPIPESALRGLFYFFTNDYQLEILSFEPTPKEVLQLQIMNKRVLTFDDNYTMWADKKYGERDVLSFLLHDFIHAEHFLSQPQKRLSQIGFYKFIQRILAENLLDQFFLSAEFDKHFSYLISDMNSHVIHLLKTFRAILDQYKSNENPNIWTDISKRLQPKNADADILQGALSRINTPLFSISDAEALLHFFQND